MPMSAAVIASASFTPAAAAYSAGDIISVAQEMPWRFAKSGQPIPSGCLLRVLTSVLKIDQTAILSSETSYTLQMFNVTPPSAQADNAVWSLASADLPSYLGSIALGIPVDMGAACMVKTIAIDQDIQLLNGKSSMFAELVTVGAPTFTAIARQLTLYGLILD